MSEESACIGICEIEDGYCIGCGRSAEVIFGETDSAGSDDSEAGADRIHPLPGEQVESSD
ncbi:hypothetical protein [Zoogloea sp.]|uniref:hypothetical protein n=1 Tax=Zoogloea sp. TaxID=49181 RepID=UPI002C7FDA6C|nr:DUF1289 domain-containing protein [Zoogloea sp.]